MSINRIIKRRAFKAGRVTEFVHWSAVRRGEVLASRPSYHEQAITNGERHPTYQKNVRVARAEHGLRPTSSDMCRVYGRRVG